MLLLVFPFMFIKIFHYLIFYFSRLTSHRNACILCRFRMFLSSFLPLHNLCFTAIFLIRVFSLSKFSHLPLSMYMFPSTLSIFLYLSIFSISLFIASSLFLISFPSLSSFSCFFYILSASSLALSSFLCLFSFSCSNDEA